MSSSNGKGSVLVTGAAGHIGRSVFDTLREAGHPVLGIDLGSHLQPDIVVCDLRSKHELELLFKNHSFRAVIHCAGLLPSAFQAHPLDGADVNLGGTFALMRLALAAGVNNLVFASSISVYGTGPSEHTMTEGDPAIPDDAYGVSKRAVELIGDALRIRTAFRFVSLRIARVVGPGIRMSSSPWRSQIFERPKPAASVRIPYSANARLSLVHVREVARMLTMLAFASATGSSVYNTPVETWTADELKKSVEELRGISAQVEPAGTHGGPTCNGARFAQEFGFRLRGLRDYLSDSFDNS